MKKCMITLLVAVLLCGMMLVACTPEEAAASNPGTTVPKQTTQPTQIQPKPTETQPSPTEPQPTEPPVTDPVILNFTSHFCKTDMIGWIDRDVKDIWIMNSVDDLEAVPYLQQEFEPYREDFFKTKTLIVLSFYSVRPDVINLCPTQVRRMPDGSYHLDLDHVVPMSFGDETSYIYYLIVEVDGFCDENAKVTVSITNIVD